MTQREYPNSHRNFSRTDEQFLEACRRGGVEPTVRQASKFRNRRGMAYKYRNKKDDVK